jgi:hypothetical protein
MTGHLIHKHLRAFLTPPRVAIFAAPAASSLAVRALSAVWRTIAVIYHALKKRSSNCDMGP